MLHSPAGAVMANTIDIHVAGFHLTALLETAAAPRTCAAFLSMLPIRAMLVHGRWSGEACWIPFGDLDLDLTYENHTSFPAAGQLLFYPGGISEAEILFPYGASIFASKVGQLAGNHFATVEGGREHLAALGHRVLWEGAQDIALRAADASDASGAPDASAGSQAIGAFNDLPRAEAEARLRTCCASKRWAEALTSGRPYPTPESLYDAADDVWWSLEQSDWLQAFAAHPRIGDRAAADPTAQREQAGVASASADLTAALAEANQRYEERFGRVFLICATGKSAEEMLASIRRRLGNDEHAEVQVAAAEQAKITRLRLERLLRLR